MFLHLVVDGSRDLRHGDPDVEEVRTEFDPDGVDGAVDLRFFEWGKPGFTARDAFQFLELRCIEFFLEDDPSVI